MEKGGRGMAKGEIVKEGRETEQEGRDVTEEEKKAI
jgi:hypothetical protein